jgi:uncharacterized protein YjbJ (UPF0337 family)
MNHLTYKNILEANWEEIKGEVQTKWGKLTNNDIDKINGSYKKLVARLQKIYGYALAEIEDEIAEFFEPSQFDKMKENASKKILEIKDVVTSAMNEYFQTAKQKTYDAEQAALEYVRQNPLKVVGFAAATGFLINYLYKSRK